VTAVTVLHLAVKISLGFASMRRPADVAGLHGGS
jgi:hypothetical protein